ncbi:MAG: pyrroline-5-carboxylate reductase [Alphaproteobacteria bacterium]
MNAERRPIVLVGCGKMGGALLAGWIVEGVVADRLRVVEPVVALAEAARRDHGVVVVAEPDAIEPGLDPEVVVFAVKPQIVPTALPPYRRFARAGTLFLTIAAGKTIAGFERVLGGGMAIARAMPNTPAAIGRGISAVVANRNVTAAQRALCQDLLGAVGEVVWLDDEGLLDAVTAVSGGAPAYVALLVEVLARAGARAGLPGDVALRLARAAVAGSGELIHRSPDPVETLRKNVTSPGGTTQQALAVLMADDGLQPLFDRAIAAATRRGRELAD